VHTMSWRMTLERSFFRKNGGAAFCSTLLDLLRWLCFQSQDPKSNESGE
jgi:hypothetical protein